MNSIAASECSRGSNASSREAENAMMTEMEDNYRQRAHMFRQVEFYWRRRAFAVTMLMGLLPIMAPMGNLIPHVIRPWYSLGISILNVTVVVVSIKCDMSDRVSDATMASKGYERVIDKLQNIKVEQTLSPETVRITKLFDEIKILVDSIENNITYPEDVMIPEVHYHEVDHQKPMKALSPLPLLRVNSAGRRMDNPKDLNQARKRTDNLKECKVDIDIQEAQEAVYINEVAGYAKAAGQAAAAAAVKEGKSPEEAAKLASDATRAAGGSVADVAKAASDASIEAAQAHSLAVGDRVQARKGVQPDGQDIYEELEFGTVTSLVADDKGEENVKVIWERTGQSSSIPKASWNECYQFDSEARKLKVGDKLQVRKGKNLDRVYKESDFCTITGFPLQDGQEAMGTVLDESGKACNFYSSTWNEYLVFFSEAPDIRIQCDHTSQCDAEVKVQDGQVENDSPSLPSPPRKTTGTAKA